MNSTEVLAERSLLFVSPDGDEISSTLQIGAPYVDESHGYCCDFEIPEIEKKRYAAGVDTLQALLLTLSLAESILERRCSQGR